MKNIFLVLKREYLVRVRKKSFIVMTILTPLLIAAFYGIIVWAAVGSFKNERKTIEVIDQSGLFKNKFKSDKNTTFQFTTESVAIAQKKLKGKEENLLVFIPADIMTRPEGLQIYAEKNIGSML